MIRSDIDWAKLTRLFHDGEPFPHIVIDNFFPTSVAKALEQEVPDFTSGPWMQYNNAIEKKRVLNHWDRFPPTTYGAMSYLNSATFLEHLKTMTGIDDLRADIGLHGGGWHAHGRGEKLNVHLDYSIHPKLRLERRLNLIVYLTSGWHPAWGGGLGLWTHDPDRKKPKALATLIECVHNRAVIFDTTRNSWHGLPDALECPERVVRKSLAVYYLSPPRAGISDRAKALFAPHKQQESDPAVLDLIERRSRADEAALTYRD